LEPVFEHNGVLDMNSRIIKGLIVGLLALVTLQLGGCNSPRPTDVIRSSGDYRFNKGDFEGAASEFGEIAARNPGDWEAQYKLGLSQMELKQYSAARRALEIAYSQRPKDPKVAEALAEAMFRQKDESHLFAFLRSRAETNQTPEAYILLAKYSMDLNDPDSAKTAADTAIALQTGKSTEPYLLSAQLNERLGHLDEAERRYRQAYGMNPYDPRVKAGLQKFNVKLDNTTALPPGR
jgi:tetratricopeptide (TPR) repeat protein